MGVFAGLRSINEKMAEQVADKMQSKIDSHISDGI